MSRSNQSPEQETTEIIDLIQKIIEESSNGNYIYRGEPERYPKISSTLYRRYKKEEEIDSELFDIEVAQKEMLEQVKEYTSFTDKTDILTELQHYGGATNLIDFTTDYMIALFFACDGSADKEGQVILLDKASKVGQITRPTKNQNSRVIAQKSIFVEVHHGYLEKTEKPEKYKVKSVPIPAQLKQPILGYLSKHHGISTATIYNDIHGYIKNQQKHESAYTSFYIGLTYSDKQEYETAIEYYNKSIVSNPQNANTYNNRGVAKSKLEQFKKAIDDYDEAIRLDPQNASAYNNRGLAKDKLEQNKTAIADYNEAIRIDPKYADAYNNRGLAKVALRWHKKAIADFDEAIHLKPESAEVYFGRGMTKGELGKDKEAIADFDEAIRLEPQYVKAYNNRGLAKVQIGQHQEAIDDLDEAIRQDPEYAEAYFGRGIAKGELGKDKEAIADLEYALELALQQGKQELTQIIRNELDKLK